MALLAGLLVEAADRYNALLDTNPNDSVALAHYGWMLSRAAASNPSLTTLAGDAITLLDRAVDADPELPDARWFRAVVAHRTYVGRHSGDPERHQWYTHSRPTQKSADRMGPGGQCGTTSSGHVV